MNSRSFKKISQAKKVGLFLIGTTLAWSAGLPAYIGIASAASLTSVKDTIVSSAPSAATNHTVVFTTVTAVAAAQTIAVQFSAGNSGGATNEFSLASLVNGDLTISGSGTLNQVANVGACNATVSQIYPTTITDAAGNRSVDFTVCAGDTIAPQTITIAFANNHVVSPSTVGSYVIRIAGSQTDSADTRVAIISQVTMSAKVDTSFTFTVSGLATSTSVNGTSTDVTTTATAIPFNTLVVGQIKTAAQQLNVTTNAQNGFQVTLVQNQNLLSSTGADIDLFKDSAATAVPTAWTAPLNTLGSENTYGHYGITSEDATLSAGDEFGSALFAGNINTARQVFFHSAPSDGTTANIGQTEVGFQIQIGSLQEAANDYNNTLTYVATPIF